MFVVREFDRELTLVFRLAGLVRVVWFAEGKARVVSRRAAYVTDSADRRTGPGESLPRKELLPVTAHARVMIGKVRHVGEISLCSPGSRNSVAGIAVQAFVFVGRVKKQRVLRRRACGRLLSG